MEDEAALGTGPVGDWEQQMAQLANAVLEELEEVHRPEDLPSSLRDALAAARNGEHESTS